MVEVPARAALAGNPSDGYGGAVLAVTLPSFTARARVVGGGAYRGTPAGGTALVDATVTRFARDVLPGAAPPRIDWSTTIPRSVGLGGSSAIVLAVLRALCRWYEVAIEPVELARLALSIEVDDLGIAAGLQDRIAQAVGGLTFMDFSSDPPGCERLDRRALPPLLVAWREDGAESSGVVHGDLRARWERGEAEVGEAMRALAGCARRARDAVAAGDLGALRRCADASFDARAAILTLDPRHVEMIEIARAAGAAANYTGSGGAVICLCNALRHREAVAHALREAGCECAGV